MYEANFKSVISKAGNINKILVIWIKLHCNLYNELFFFQLCQALKYFIGQEFWFFFLIIIIIILIPFLFLNPNLLNNEQLEKSSGLEYWCGQKWALESKKLATTVIE